MKKFLDEETGYCAGRGGLPDISFFHEKNNKIFFFFSSQKLLWVIMILLSTTTTTTAKIRTGTCHLFL